MKIVMSKYIPADRIFISISFPLNNRIFVKKADAEVSEEVTEEAPKKRTRKTTKKAEEEPAE